MTACPCPGCGRTQLRFKEKCFALFAGPVTWQEAVEKCKEDTGLLASLDSSGEEQFLLEHLLRGNSDILDKGGCPIIYLLLLIIYYSTQCG